MILRLDVPPVPKAVSSLRVDRWCVQEGDQVGFGDVIVELVMERWLKRTFKQTDAEGPRPPRMPVDVDEIDLISRTGGDRIEVVASDTGALRLIVADVGATVGPDALLAVLTSEPDEPVAAGDADGALPFRAVGDIVIEDT
jgi:hypothetical protein